MNPELPKDLSDLATEPNQSETNNPPEVEGKDNGDPDRQEGTRETDEQQDVLSEDFWKEVIKKKFEK